GPSDDVRGRRDGERDDHRAAGLSAPPSLRKACSRATTWAPSPTAAATRLTEPQRTSPIANTPRRLGSRRSRAAPASCPVRTNPFASGATPAPDSPLVVVAA